MKPNKLQKILVCSAIALTLPAVAATNPAGSTPPFNGAQNPATAGGQGDIVGGNTTATGGAATNPTGAGAGKDPAPTLPIQNESVQEAIETCPLVTQQEDVFEEALRIASIVPDIDEIFNPANEAAAGCFAASSKVINLAMEIPSVSFSLTGIGDLVKKNLEKILLQKAEEVLNKGCAIADTALLGALDPLQKYFDEYNQRVGDFNGMVGNREMGADYEHKGIYENAANQLRGRRDGTQADITAAAAALAALDKEMRDRWGAALEESPLVSGGGFGGGQVGGGAGTGGGTPVPPFFGDNPPTPTPTPAGRGMDEGGWADNTTPRNTPASRPSAAPTPPASTTTPSNPFSAGNKPAAGSPF